MNIEIIHNQTIRSKRWLDTMDLDMDKQINGVNPSAKQEHMQMVG